jgi:hypothetical protein
MQTQIQCPNCRSPITADIYQLLDVDQAPQIKEALLGGGINMAQCQNCGWTGQVAAPLVYHDSAHDLLMTFVPMELNLPYDQQERMMGQLVRAVVESVPQEKRRAYLLQPQQIFRWQTFMEKVYETEGITPEMLAKQQRQIELLQTLIKADNDVVTYLLNDRKADVDDDTFVQMVQATLQQAVQAQQTEAMTRLSNLQYYVMTKTAAGKRAEKRQIAMNALQQEAKAKNGVTPQMVAEHVIKNMDDDATIDAIVEATGAISYEFFGALSQQIDAAAKAGETRTVTRLTEIRTRLLTIYDEMQKVSAQLMKDALKTVNTIARAPDKRVALQQMAEQIDEAFMITLEQQLEIAQDSADLDRILALKEIQKHLEDMMRQSNDPSMQMITAMLQAPSPEALGQFLNANAQYVNQDLLMAFDALSAELPDDAPQELRIRLGQLRTIVEQHLLTTA